MASVIASTVGRSSRCRDRPAPVCGEDALKADVVFFGETVPSDRVDHCFDLVDRAGSLLVLGLVCEATPADRADYPATADRVSALAGDLLSREQALQIVKLAAQELCA